jgi:hypothetical protein
VNLVGEPVSCRNGCGMLLILNETTGRYHELASHNPHKCPNRPKTTTSNYQPSSYSSFTKYSKNEHKNSWDRYPRRKACVIICPIAGCNHVCVQRNQGEKFESPEDGTPLAIQLKNHVKEAHTIKVTDAFMSMLEDKITYLANHPRLRYMDPFVGVDFEQFFMKERIEYKISENPQYGKTANEIGKK